MPDKQNTQSWTLYREQQMNAAKMMEKVKKDWEEKYPQGYWVMDEFVVPANPPPQSTED